MVYNPEADTPIVSVDQSPLVPVQAAAELEHLLEKPYLTARELKRLVDLFSRLLGHPLTGSADNYSPRGFLSFFREGGYVAVHPGTGEPDSLQLTLIVSQSLSEGIKGVSEEARKKVRPLPQVDLHRKPY